MPFKLARLCSMCELSFTMNAMFDWPEQSHTSPMTTFLYSIFFFSHSTVMVYFLPSDIMGVKRTFQLPSWAALVTLFCRPKRTTISLPASAVPLTTKGTSRCTTMLSLYIAGKDSPPQSSVIAEYTCFAMIPAPSALGCRASGIRSGRL